jgi:hypothetical protein
MYAGYEDQIYEEQPKVLYVFANDNKHVAIIRGSSDEACEEAFDRLYGPDDFWSDFNPRWGSRLDPGDIALDINGDAAEIDADSGRPSEDDFEEEQDLG